METQHIVIIGAGFSGTMLTVHLLHHAPYPLVISLIDKSGKFAEGVAYGTTNPRHLLNVRAERMSAYPAHPNHLVEWLESTSLPFTAKDFIPRMVYGDYLKDQLEQALDSAPGKGHIVRLLPYAVKEIGIKGSKCLVHCDTHTPLEADAVIMALGSLPPKHYPYEKKLFSAPYRFANNVWNPPVGNILHPQAETTDKTVAIIGSGLTTVDSLITLRDKGVTGKIIIFSRHGNMPSIHQTYTPYPVNWDIEQLPNTALGLLMWLRATLASAKEDGYHWQAVIDSLRPVTNPIWERLPTREKRKFMRHLFSLWNSHRHRMPQESAAIMEEMQQSGQVEHIKGSLIDVELDGDQLVVSYHKKYMSGIQTLRVDYLLNGTGPESDIGKITPKHLLYRLYDMDYISIGALRSGLEQQHGHVRGEAIDYLFTMGPILFGGLFETIAVPELRVQAQDLAQHVLGFIKERNLSQFVI